MSLELLRHVKSEASKSANLFLLKHKLLCWMFGCQVVFWWVSRLLTLWGLFAHLSALSALMMGTIDRILLNRWQAFYRSENKSPVYHSLVINTHVFLWRMNKRKPWRDWQEWGVSQLVGDLGVYKQLRVCLASIRKSMLQDQYITPSLGSFLLACYFITVAEWHKTSSIGGR